MKHEQAIPHIVVIYVARVTITILVAVVVVLPRRATLATLVA
jgi:hypothetical protein